MYYRPAVRKSGRKFLYAATALVLIVLIIDALTGGAIRSQVRFLGSSISKRLPGMSMLMSRAALEAKNTELAAQNARLSERAALADALQDENETLRKLVNLAPREQGITAPVVSSVLASPYGTFLIGTGNEGSIRRGDLVLTEGGFVIGRVSDASLRTALVAEVFSPGSSLDVLVKGVPTTLQGQGGGNGRLEVPRSVSVSAGDIVFAPAFGQRPVGLVGAVASSSASASQQVYVRIPTNLAALQFVYVVSPGN